MKYVFLYEFYKEKMKNAIIYDVQLKPVYVEKNGKLKGWEVSYWGVECKIFPTRMQWARFFKETWFRNSYRAACRFQRRLVMKQNENNK